MKNKGQVTIFVIIAVIIIGAVVGYFVLREQLKIAVLPSDMQPVYTTFLSCLEEETATGISVLESQGGYIELPEFSPGSSYMPFSSQLNFLGNPIPYWYYVSGNNIEKEQIPSKEDIEKELENFIEEKIRGCVFDSYYENGFEINQGEPDADVLIRNSDVLVNLNMNLNIIKGEESANIASHKINFKSSLGTLYSSARKVYEHEQSNLFLEEYAIDTLRLYAPVDGVEFSCSPKTWNVNAIFNDLRESIETNTLALKTKGNTNDYFKIDIPINEEVRFLNSRDWTYNFEVNPSQGSILIANPVGNQPGLGMLGFCYVTYHFVYNVKYPVLVQVQKEDEIFQFPMAVIVQGNKPRKPLDTSTLGITSLGICDYKNTELEVRAYDNKMNTIDADVSYECFGEVCHIGKTSGGFLSTEFPQCVNGFILLKADGFEDTRYMFSTTQSGSVDIILDKTYKTKVNLKLDGKIFNEKAIITFAGDESSSTILYPEQKEVELSEGEYEIQIQIYDESSLNLEKGSYQQCIEIPSVLGSLFGNQKKCFDVAVPSQIISNALSGGGKETYYITESELNSGNMEINAESLPSPKTLEELQNNYILFEDKGLEISFR